jgi:hypothetical protein
VLPQISDPWAIPIDSKGIVRRKKLKSNVEMSSTRTVVLCPDCDQVRRLGVTSHCCTCDGYGRVEMVYSVQVSRWERREREGEERVEDNLVIGILHLSI